MNTEDSNFLTRIRKNFSLLTFLSITLFLTVLWWLLALLVLASGGYASVNTDAVFYITLFVLVPLIGGAIISALAIFVSILLRNENSTVGCLVIIMLGIVIPLIAFILVAIGVTIARKFYLGDPKEIPDITPAFAKTQPAPSQTPITPSAPTATPPTIPEGNVVEKLTALQELRDKGLISENEYQEKKASILAKM